MHPLAVLSHLRPRFAYILQPAAEEPACIKCSNICGVGAGGGLTAGMTLPTALAAPVLAGMMLAEAQRPARLFACIN